jgi:putative pyruvate formate lyase activating enzyme
MMIASTRPAYLSLHQSGELQYRIDRALALLSCCTLCPRQCRVNRRVDERGLCGIGRQAMVASYTPHFGEESPLVGSGGSGTIFFSGCNLRCVFCQNYEISQGGEGVSVSSGRLAAMMLSLQKQGCHNINFVTPSHVVPQILEALPIAVENGLTLPLVYNSSGYDAGETIRLLDGVFDIYMPDFKFWSAASSRRYCAAPDYPEKARQAIKEMQRQVGELVLDGAGVAVKGVLVRHLVMPGGLAETARIMEFIAAEISKDTYVNVMEQYRPCGEAGSFAEINRMLRNNEYQEAMEIARRAGLRRLDQRNWQRLFRKLGDF